MSLLAILQSLGDRLGIIETSRPASEGGSVPKVRTRSVKMAELMTEIRSAEVRSLADRPAELSISYEKIFEAAGVEAAPHGWDTDRLLELLRSPEFEGLSREAAQARLLKLLEEDGIRVEDLVRDAVARDRALDEFEISVEKKIQDRGALRLRRIAEVDSELREIEAQRTLLREQGRNEEVHWREWRSAKGRYERELARGIGLLIDREVITTDEE